MKLSIISKDWRKEVMSKNSQDQAQRFATLLSGAIKGMAYYPAGHPAVLQPIRDIAAIAAEAFKVRPEIRFGVLDGVFFVDEFFFFTPQAAIEDLAERLSGKGANGITFCRGLTAAQLIVFIELLVAQDISAAMMAETLATQGITSIIVSRELEIEPDEVAQESAEDEQGHFAPLQAYNEALGAIRDVFRDIKSGRIPNSDKVIMVVTNLASLTMQDPAALLGLAMIKDYDNYTFNHSVNVGVIAMTLGASLRMNRDEVADVGIAGFLHDIGKTRIEKPILNKPGKLSAAEFELMKKHSEDGAQIISEMTGLKPQIAQAVLGHHLRHNRQGYPEWARDIPVGIMAEIIAVADCYDAMTTLRVYQQPLNPKAALDRIRSFAGTHLDGSLVDKFVEIMGLYPVGTLIRLDNNEIAVVCKPNPENKEAPTVKVIIDATGQRLEIPVMQMLADGEGTCYASIVDVVDPLVRNIDVAEFLN